MAPTPDSAPRDTDQSPPDMEAGTEALWKELTNDPGVSAIQFGFLPHCETSNMALAALIKLRRASPTNEKSLQDSRETSLADEPPAKRQKGGDDDDDDHEDGEKEDEASVQDSSDTSLVDEPAACDGDLFGNSAEEVEGGDDDEEDDEEEGEEEEEEEEEDDDDEDDYRPMSQPPTSPAEDEKVDEDDAGKAEHEGGAKNAEAAELRVRMVRKWESVLKEPVAPKKAGTWKSPRKTPRKQIPDPQLLPDSQESNATDATDTTDATEDNRYDSGRKCGFPVGMTTEEALKKLYVGIEEEEEKKKKKNRKQKNKKKASKKMKEETHTQYAVNRLIAAVLPELEEMYTRYGLSGLNNSYAQCTELGYYEETTHHHNQNLRRHPDSLLYIKGVGASTRLDQEALSLGSLVSFEHKLSILQTKRFNKALTELERDYAEKMCAEDLCQLGFGYGVMTDGINWRFYRFHAEIQKGYREAKMTAENLATVAICERGKDEKYKFKFDDLARELLSIFERSLSRRGKPTHKSFDSRSFKIWKDENPHRCRVDQFLRFGRRTVMKATQHEQGRKIPLVVKYPRFIFDEKQEIDQQEELLWGLSPNSAKYKSIEKELQGMKGLAMKEMDTMRKELKNLKDLAKEATKQQADVSIVKLAAGFEDYSKMVVMEDVGVGLNKVVCSGEAGRLLAKVVHRDIWLGALKFLRELNICHADIHEGNICVRLEADTNLKAVLIDLESAVPYEAKLRLTPIKNRNPEKKLFVELAAASWDRASTCSILECLWKDDLSLLDVEKKTGEWVTWFGENKQDPPLLEKIATWPWPTGASAVEDENEMLPLVVDTSGSEEDAAFTMTTPLRGFH